VNAIVAAYSGNGSLDGSQSAPVRVTVDKYLVTVDVTSSQSPSILGSSVTFTAKVTPAAGAPGTPTGQVDFFDGGILLSTVTVQGGQVSLTVSNLAAGPHTIRANYKGDSTFQGALGSTTQTVNRIPTVTTLVPAPSGASGTTLSATVTFQGPG